MARAGSLQCSAAVCVVGPWNFEDLNFSEEKDVAGEVSSAGS